MTRYTFYTCDVCGKKSEPVDASDTRYPLGWSVLPPGTWLGGAVLLTGEHVFCSSACLLLTLNKNGIHP